MDAFSNSRKTTTKFKNKIFQNERGKISEETREIWASQKFEKMGVKTLWSVLSGSGEMIDLRELQGSTVAIDLAGWIVQNNTCKAMAGSVSRPHLRNLFFRVASMVNLNIKPVFVLDGNAPDLKKETLEARRKAQSQDPTATKEVKNFSRARLKGLMGECKALLDALGISSVKAEGNSSFFGGHLCIWYFSIYLYVKCCEKVYITAMCLA